MLSTIAYFAIGANDIWMVPRWRAWNPGIEAIALHDAANAAGAQAAEFGPQVTGDFPGVLAGLKRVAEGA